MNPVRLLPLLAVAVPLVGQGASACSPGLRTFESQLATSDFAIRARPRFNYTHNEIDGTSDDGLWHLAGTVRLTEIHCYKQPEDLGRCPTTLEFEFDEVYFIDGINCPPDMDLSTRERWRYFLLRRDEEGDWQLDGAWRRYDRLR